MLDGTKKLNIVLVGAFSSDASVYTYASSFVKNFTLLGHNVTPFNYRKIYIPLTNQKSFINTFISNKALITTVQKIKPDIVFLLKAETITAKTIALIKQQSSAKIVIFHPDNPFTLWNGNSSQEILMALPLYDCFLSWSGLLTTTLKTAGCKHVCPFPFAYDQTMFPSQIPKKAPPLYDVCFVGTWEPEREFLLATLIERLPTLKVAIWGNMWDTWCTNQQLLSRVYSNAIYGQDMITIFQQSKIVLNFIRQQNATAHNMRTFEVPASGAFLMTQETTEQASVLFTNNENIVCFTTIDDMIDKIKFYLDNNTMRDIIAHKSFNHVQQYSMHNQLYNYLESCDVLY